MNARPERAFYQLPMPAHRHPHTAGFTLIELVVVLMLIGIVSAVAGARFFNLADYQARRYADQLQAALRHAQLVAIATRDRVQVTVDTVAPTALIAADCTAAGGTAVRSPHGSGQLMPTPSGGSIGLAVAGQALPLALCFNGLGQPFFANSAQGTAITSALVFTISGGSDNLTFQIEPETGFIH